MRACVKYSLLALLALLEAVVLRATTSRLSRAPGTTPYSVPVRICPRFVMLRSDARKHTFKAGNTTPWQHTAPFSCPLFTCVPTQAHRPAHPRRDMTTWVSRGALPPAESTR